jgi:hypothetical protein
MPDPEAPRLRLASVAPEAAHVPALEPPLARIVAVLEAAGFDAPGATETLQQRLGDARTVALLAQGGTAGAIAERVVRTCGLASDAVRVSLAERPEDASGRLARVRNAGPLRFGQVLVAQGVLAPRRLEDALEAQKASRRRIGEELVAAGHITAKEVAEALWLQHKIAAATLALIVSEAERAAASPRLVRSKS